MRILCCISSTPAASPATGRLSSMSGNLGFPYSFARTILLSCAAVTSPATKAAACTARPPQRTMMRPFPLPASRLVRLRAVAGQSRLQPDPWGWGGCAPTGGFPSLPQVGQVGGDAFAGMLPGRSSGRHDAVFFDIKPEIDMKTIAIIPAKGNSLRCPHKDLREFMGLPLFLHSAFYAQNEGLAGSKTDIALVACWQGYMNFSRAARHVDALLQVPMDAAFPAPFPQKYKAGQPRRACATPRLPSAMRQCASATANARMTCASPERRPALYFWGNGADVLFFDGTFLPLKWDKWGTEHFQKEADGSYVHLRTWGAKRPKRKKLSLPAFSATVVGESGGIHKTNLCPQMT